MIAKFLSAWMSRSRASRWRWPGATDGRGEVSGGDPSERYCRDEACSPSFGQAWQADVLVRGGANRGYGLLSADRRARSRVPSRCALAHSAQPRRSGQDQSARRVEPGAPAAGGRTDSRLSARRTARGDAGSGGLGERSSQAPGATATRRASGRPSSPGSRRRRRWRVGSHGRLRRGSPRYRALIKRGKTNTVAVTAIARELTGFIWAIDRALRDETTAA